MNSEIEVIEEQVPESKVRFNDAPWSKHKFEIFVLGAGGIGSWVALCLSRIGHILHVFDFDKYELVNMAGQFVVNRSLGKNKADSLIDTLKLFNEEHSLEAYSYDSKVDDSTELGAVIFSCFDNMEARKIAFETWCKSEDRYLFIDGRLTAESYQVFIVTPNSIDRYKATLFSDEEASDLPCSYKSTTHTSMMIAAEMVNMMNQYVAYGDVPFRIDYDLRTFNHTYEL